MFEDFIQNKDSWLSGRGPESEIVFSSRIRLARNTSASPFPFKACDEEKARGFELIRQVYASSVRLRTSTCMAMDELSDLDKQLLVERHLVSQEHTAPGKGKGLIVSKNEEIAIMVNEEDFLRMQVITSGSNLAYCWDILNDIDNDISRKVEYSFLPDLGYLTACPTNVGTAMRASCMLHLPALILTKRINKILELLSRISFTARGLFGEGTQALGNFFQISNQVSLGLSEEELIDNLIGVVKQVKDQEMDARELLLKKFRLSISDSVWRALGTLKSCRLINSKEALGHLSILSLGLDLGIISSTDLAGAGGKELINRLFLMIQPAHLQKIEGKPLKEDERDSILAEILRKELGAAA